MTTITVDDHPLHYVSQGEGKLTLLFVHGSGCDHSLWKRQIESLSDQYHVAALDLNGHGLSSARAGEGLECYTHDVLAVLDHINRPTMVLGHSLGGAVAQCAALQGHPQLVALGLVNTGARLRVLPSLLKLLEEDFDGAVDFLLGLLFHRSVSVEVQQTREQMLKNGQAATSRDFNACDQFDVIDQLTSIQLPSWVCVGEQDQMTPVKYAQFLQQKLINASLTVIPDCGHMTMLEQPDAFSARLRAFLADL